MTDQKQTTDPAPIEPAPAEPAPAESTPKPVKTGKLASLRRDPFGWIVLLMGLATPLAYVIAAGGSGLRLWGWKSGLAAMPWIILAAFATLLLVVAIVAVNRRRARKTRWPLLGLGTAAVAGFLAYLAPFGTAYLSLPAIHDITTDLADPPQFTALNLRADNWDNIPGADDSDMRGMNPRQRWATAHQDAYPDIRSVRIDQPVAVVIEKAQRLAKDRGWSIISVDPASGNLEATDTVSLFRFENDIVIRARAAENGASSIIDMRSVSRVGVHDLGVNAKRVRRFLSDLSGTTSAASQ